MMELINKTAIVTGAGRGIGKAISQELAALGAAVILMGRDVTRLTSLSAELSAKHGREFPVIELDVSNAQSVARAFSKSAQAQILVNNAGLAESAPLHKTDLEVWDRVIAVNLRGVFLCTKEALPKMLAAKQGRVINIASTAALRGYRYVSAYCASKHAVLGLTRSLALEIEGQGVTANAICPGYTNTDLLKESIRKIAERSGRSEDDVRKDFVKDSAHGRLVEPEEVAKKVAWLCLDAQSRINGEAIVVE